MSFFGHIGKKKNKRPVCVTFFFADIFGKIICFYDVTSRFSDSVMIEKYLEKNYPVKYDNGTRRAMTNADNFHLAVCALKPISLK